MAYDTLLFSVDGGIARLTLNRPDRLNSFNTQMHTEVRHALEQLPGSGARVLVLTGAGRGFCAGQDLGDRAVAPGSRRSIFGESIDKYYKPLVLALQDCPCPSSPPSTAWRRVPAPISRWPAISSSRRAQPASCRRSRSSDCFPIRAERGPCRAWSDKARALGLRCSATSCRRKQAAAWGMIWQCVEDAELGSRPSIRWRASWRRRRRADWPGPRRPFAAAGNARCRAARCRARCPA